jgi:hypothetical protein
MNTRQFFHSCQFLPNAPPSTAGPTVYTMHVCLYPKTAQRGLCVLDAYTAIYYTIGANLMYIRCYSTWADDDTKEQLWLAIKPNGWMSAGPIKSQCYFYIPETVESWCKIIDPLLTHIPANDYIV